MYRVFGGIGVKVENRIRSKAEQIPEFLTAEGSVARGNLLKFKRMAEYADGRDEKISGRVACYRYAREMKERVEESGGRFIFNAEVVGFCWGVLKSHGMPSPSSNAPRPGRSR
jgi:glycine/D-amino acid oxidase-like deaminating enzyme